MPQPISGLAQRRNVVLAPAFPEFGSSARSNASDAVTPATVCSRDVTGALKEIWMLALGTETAGPVGVPPVQIRTISPTCSLVPSGLTGVAMLTLAPHEVAPDIFDATISVEQTKANLISGPPNE